MMPITTQSQGSVQTSGATDSESDAVQNLLDFLNAHDDETEPDLRDADEPEPDSPDAAADSTADGSAAISQTAPSDDSPTSSQQQSQVSETSRLVASACCPYSPCLL